MVNVPGTFREIQNVFRVSNTSYSMNLPQKHLNLFFRAQNAACVQIHEHTLLSLCALLESRKSVIGMRNIETAINGTFQCTKYSASRRGSCQTYIQIALEWSINFLSRFPSRIGHVRNKHISVQFPLSRIILVQFQLPQQSTKYNKTDTKCNGLRLFLKN